MGGPVTGGVDGKSGEEDLHDDSNNDGSKKGTFQDQKRNQSLKSWSEVDKAANSDLSSRSNKQLAEDFSDQASKKAANQVDNDLKPKIEGLTRVSLPGSSSADKSSTGLAGKAGEPAKAVEPARAEGSELVEAPAAAGEAPADEVKKGKDVARDVGKTE